MSGSVLQAVFARHRPIADSGLGFWQFQQALQEAADVASVPWATMRVAAVHAVDNYQEGRDVSPGKEKVRPVSLKAPRGGANALAGAGARRGGGRGMVCVWGALQMGPVRL